MKYQVYERVNGEEVKSDVFTGSYSFVIAQLLETTGASTEGELWEMGFRVEQIN